MTSSITLIVITGTFSMIIGSYLVHWNAPYVWSVTDEKNECPYWQRVGDLRRPVSVSTSVVGLGPIPLETADSCKMFLQFEDFASLASHRHQKQELIYFLQNRKAAITPQSIYAPFGLLVVCLRLLSQLMQLLVMCRTSHQHQNVLHPLPRSYCFLSSAAASFKDRSSVTNQVLLEQPKKPPRDSSPVLCWWPRTSRPRERC